MKKVVGILKNLQVVFGFLGLGGLALLQYLSEIVVRLKGYELHLIFIGFLFAIALFIVNDKRIISLKTSLNKHMINSRKEMLRANVKQLAKELSNVKVIDKEHTIRYIYDLEETRKELELNSYTQATLEDMIKRIEIRI